MIRSFIPLFIGLGLLPFILNLDFKKDPGENKKAKVYHSIYLILLLLVFSSSISNFSWTVRDWESLSIMYDEQVGFIPAKVNVFIFFTGELVSFLIILFTYRMMTRKNSARKWIIRLLPLSMFNSWVKYYRASNRTEGSLEYLISGTSDAELYTVVLPFILIQLGFVVSFILVYRSTFMTDFFHYKRIDESEEFQNFGKEELDINSENTH